MPPQCGGQKGGDLFDLAVSTATDLFVEHGLRWMGKKAVDVLRNKNLQKKAINNGLKKLTPITENVGEHALDQL